MLKTARGGSAFSLFNLVKGIKSNGYRPTVLFVREDHPLIPSKLREMGVTTIVLKKKLHAETIPNDGSSVNVKKKKLTISRKIENRFGKSGLAFYLAAKSCLEFFRYHSIMILPIIKLIRKEHISLIHLNSGLRCGQGAIIASLYCRIPIVCHCRWFSKWTLFEKIFIRMVDKFIYISTAVQKHFKQIGVPAQKGIVINNALDLKDYHSDYNTTKTRTELCIDENDKVFGIIGRLVEWKGHIHFLEAIAMTLKKGNSIKGVIVGEPPNTMSGRNFYQYLKLMTKKMGIAENILFTGFREDIPRIVLAMDVVVHCSTRPEPFGRVIIEGMAAGKPVIATAAGGVYDIIEDGKTGLLVPMGDSKFLANAMKALLSDPKKMNQMGQLARESVESRFTIKSHAQAVRNVYNAVV